MITDNLTHLDNYIKLLPDIALIKDFLNSYSFKDLPVGKTVLNERVDVIKINYITKSYEERFCEVHEKKIDMHVIFQGQEQIGIQDRIYSEILDYVEEHDYSEAKAELKLFKLKANDFMILYPHEVHATAIMVESPEQVDKLVFKITL